jgi:hypothetical protein
MCLNNFPPALPRNLILKWIDPAPHIALTLTKDSFRGNTDNTMRILLEFYAEAIPDHIEGT